MAAGSGVTTVEVDRFVTSNPPLTALELLRLRVHVLVTETEVLGVIRLVAAMLYPSEEDGVYGLVVLSAKAPESWLVDEPVEGATIPLKSIV